MEDNANSFDVLYHAINAISLLVILNNENSHWGYFGIPDNETD